jgi:peptide/nickel transport system permease protein
MYLAVTLLMFSSLLLIVGNLLADLLLAWVDPRARNLD